MKKYLIIALAALGFAACAEKLENNTPHSGEVGSSYIAISLSATDPTTRADDGTYQEGTVDERAVETAYFFFFDADGKAFPVTISDGAANGTTNGESSKNYLQASLTTTTGEAMNNVSDIKNVVLLLKNYKGTYPAQIVAVLNWVPSGNTYDLKNLQEQLVDVRSTVAGDLNGKFIMSNAVYAKNGSAVYATPLTENDIFTDEVNAKANPVTIYVERVAAKVTVTTTDGKDVFDLNKPVTIGGSNTPVYAKILGWELYNDYQQSYLVKNIDPTWTDDALGFTWNDSPWYRSYWAISPTSSFGDDNQFQYEYTSGYGYNFGTAANVTAGTYAANTYTYCGENTNREASDRTKIILKAQLQKKNGDSVELARWYTTEYLGEQDLLKAVANTLKYTLYSKEGDKYVGLTPEDLQCVSPTYVGGNISNNAPKDIKSYQVFFQLSTTGKDKTWYKNNGGTMQSMRQDGMDINDDPNGAIATNAYLSSNVEPAILYKSGQTYYYIDIKHLGNGEDDNDTGDYGIVRNHIYALNINSIGGYGSPVYTSTSNILTPEYPEYPGEDDEKSFVSAEVRILSWRIVSQGVDIQPGS